MSPDWERQNRLHAAVERVRGRSAGFVDARLDVPALAVFLYWHREVPAEVAERAVAESARGIAVELRSTPYTMDELTAEAVRILKTCAPAVKAGPNRDRTGVTVGIDTREAPLDSVRVESRMPVEFVAAGRATPIGRD